MTEPHERDTASPSHQRPPFSDPLPGGKDPTAPGAPHEPGGADYRQSQGTREGEQDASASPTGDREPEQA